MSDSTYFFYSSDHGFQLGQFNIPMDKRQVYEWDTKIHLVGRGPGIKHGHTFANPGTQVDIAPTLLGLAGIKIPAAMDGKSIVPFLVDADDDALLDSTREHLTALGDLSTYAKNWRKEVFIEYYYCNWNVKCTSVEDCPTDGPYPQKDSSCVNLQDNTDCWCGGDWPMKEDGTCFATEDTTNNFIAIRDLRPGSNIVYAEYQTGDQTDTSIEFDKVDFREYYDLDADAVQLQNKAVTVEQSELDALSHRLHAWFTCAGETCP